MMKPFSMERIFDAPISEVWNALTQKDLMKLWYFDLKEFEPKVGFKFEFTGGPSPDRQYVHECEIIEVIIEQKLKHSWSYKGYEGISFVTFELFKMEDHKTKLVLTHEGLESFPTSNLDFAIDNFIAGWTFIINTSLNNFLIK